ncbi:uncharacterized protein [Amphiura filiformis]|uniref:uncharacterized protein n=1 Tax=Amphiura filiformis TaxID=82378 RepID=UPI003B2197E5
MFFIVLFAVSCLLAIPLITEGDIDECASSPCLNGGTCEDESLFYRCHCASGYTGDICQTDIYEVLIPCLNGGIIIDISGSYICRCAAGFTGIICETEISSTTEANSGHQSGTIIGGVVALSGVAGVVFIVVFSIVIGYYFKTRKSQNNRTAPPIVGEDGYVQYKTNIDASDPCTALSGNQPPVSGEIRYTGDYEDIDSINDSTSNDTNDIEHTYAYSYAYTDRGNKNNGILGGEKNERSYINGAVRR